MRSTNDAHTDSGMDGVLEIEPRTVVVRPHAGRRATTIWTGPPSRDDLERANLNGTDPSTLDLTSMRVARHTDQVDDSNADFARRLHLAIGGQRVMTWDRREWADGRGGDLLASRLADPRGVLPVSRLAPLRTFAFEVEWDDEALERLSTRTTEPERREEVEYGDFDERVGADGKVESVRCRVFRRRIETGETTDVWTPVEVQTPRIAIGMAPSAYRMDASAVDVPFWQRFDHKAAGWIASRCNVRVDPDGTSWFENVLHFDSGTTKLCFSRFL